MLGVSVLMPGRGEAGCEGAWAVNGATTGDFVIAAVDAEAGTAAPADGEAAGVEKFPLVSFTLTVNGRTLVWSYRAYPEFQSGSETFDRGMQAQLAEFHEAVAAMRAARGSQKPFVVMAAHPLLSRELETYAFLRFNYFKYQLWLASRAPEKNRDVEEIRQAYDQAIAFRNVIVQGNLRQLKSIVGRHGTRQRAADDMMSELLASHFMPLIDKFDYRVGVRFNSFYFRTICARMAEVVQPRRFQEKFEQAQQLRVFSQPHERQGEGSVIDHDEPAAPAPALSTLEIEEIRLLVGSLGETDRFVIERYFGLDGAEPETYLEISEHLHVSRAATSARGGRVLQQLGFRLRSADPRTP